MIQPEISSRASELVKGPNKAIRKATAKKAKAIKPKALLNLVAMIPGMTRLSITMLRRLQA